MVRGFLPRKMFEIADARRPLRVLIHFKAPQLLINCLIFMEKYIFGESGQNIMSNSFFNDVLRLVK